MAPLDAIDAIVMVDMGPSGPSTETPVDLKKVAGLYK